MIRTLVVVAIGLWPLFAHADEAKARQLYESGERAYNLGEWQKAIELFRQAYEEQAEPAFLFNLAQTYRQAGDCKQALFFYKRFLALKVNDTKKPLKPALKTEVEQRIAELDECIKRDLASKPPDQLDAGTNNNGGATTPPPTKTEPAPTKTAAAATNEGGDDNEDHQTPAPTSAPPSLISLRAMLGVARLSAGRLATSFQAGAALIGGYPLMLGDKLELDLGAAITFTPVPFTTSMSTKGTLGVIGLLVNAGPSFAVIPKLSVRGDVGIGALVLTGLEQDGNPFTQDGSPATGALSTFMARVALSADYAVTPNVIITAMPIAFSYSTVPAGFDPTIKSLTTLSFMAGVGYRR